MSYEYSEKISIATWCSVTKVCLFSTHIHTHIQTHTHTHSPCYHLTKTLSDLTLTHCTHCTLLISVPNCGCWYSPVSIEVSGFVEGVMFIDCGAGLGLRVRSIFPITPEDFFQSWGRSPPQSIAHYCASSCGSIRAKKTKVIFYGKISLLMNFACCAVIEITCPQLVWQS